MPSTGKTLDFCASRLTCDLAGHRRTRRTRAVAVDSNDHPRPVGVYAERTRPEDRWLGAGHDLHRRGAAIVERRFLRRHRRVILHTVSPNRRSLASGGLLAHGRTEFRHGRCQRLAPQTVESRVDGWHGGTARQDDQCRQQAGATLHGWRARSVNALAKDSRPPARPVSLKISAVRDCTEASSTFTPLLERNFFAAATASSIGPPVL
jgi:hypothetical protein